MDTTAWSRPHGGLPSPREYPRLKWYLQDSHYAQHPRPQRPKTSAAAVHADQAPAAAASSKQEKRIGRTSAPGPLHSSLDGAAAAQLPAGRPFGSGAVPHPAPPAAAPSQAPLAAAPVPPPASVVGPPPPGITAVRTGVDVSIVAVSDEPAAAAVGRPAPRDSGPPAAPTTQPGAGKGLGRATTATCMPVPHVAMAAHLPARSRAAAATTSDARPQHPTAPETLPGITGGTPSTSVPTGVDVSVVVLRPGARDSLDGLGQDLVGAAHGTSGLVVSRAHHADAAPQSSVAGRKQLQPEEPLRPSETYEDVLHQARGLDTELHKSLKLFSSFAKGVTAKALRRHSELSAHLHSSEFVQAVIFRADKRCREYRRSQAVTLRVQPPPQVQHQHGQRVVAAQPHSAHGVTDREQHGAAPAEAGAHQVGAVLRRDTMESPSRTEGGHGTRAFTTGQAGGGEHVHVTPTTSDGSPRPSPNPNPVPNPAGGHDRVRVNDVVGVVGSGGGGGGGGGGSSGGGTMGFTQPGDGSVSGAAASAIRHEMGRATSVVAASAVDATVSSNAERASVRGVIDGGEARCDSAASRPEQGISMAVDQHVFIGESDRSRTGASNENQGGARGDKDGSRASTLQLEEGTTSSRGAQQVADRERSAVATGRNVTADPSRRRAFSSGDTTQVTAEATLAVADTTDGSGAGAASSAAASAAPNDYALGNAVGAGTGAGTPAVDSVNPSDASQDSEAHGGVGATESISRARRRGTHDPSLHTRPRLLRFEVLRNKPKHPPMVVDVHVSTKELDKRFEEYERQRRKDRRRGSARTASGEPADVVLDPPISIAGRPRHTDPMVLELNSEHSFQDVPV